MEGCFKGREFQYAGAAAAAVTSVMSNSVWPSGLLPARLLCPGHSLGKSTGVGCHALLNMLVNSHQISLLCQWSFPSNFVELLMNLKRQLSTFRSKNKRNQGHSEERSSQRCSDKTMTFNQQCKFRKKWVVIKYSRGMRSNCVFLRLDNAQICSTGSPHGECNEVTGMDVYKHTWTGYQRTIVKRMQKHGALLLAQQ